VHGAQLSILDGSTGKGTRMRIDFPEALGLIGQLNPC
jgi:hypothetical protein